MSSDEAPYRYAMRSVWQCCTQVFQQGRGGLPTLVGVGVMSLSGYRHGGGTYSRTCVSEAIRGGYRRLELNRKDHIGCWEL